MTLPPALRRAPSIFATNPIWRHVLAAFRRDLFWAGGAYPQVPDELMTRGDAARPQINPSRPHAARLLAHRHGAAPRQLPPPKR